MFISFTVFTMRSFQASATSNSSARSLCSRHDSATAASKLAQQQRQRLPRRKTRSYSNRPTANVILTHDFVLCVLQSLSVRDKIDNLLAENSMLKQTHVRCTGFPLLTLHCRQMHSRRKRQRSSC